MTESNVFNQSFDDLLAQAGVAGGATDVKPAEKEEQKTESTVMSFDDILQQEGLEDVTDNPTAVNEPVEEPNITEEYRVTTDVFGENDKPNDVPTFDELMAQAGGVKPVEEKPEPVAKTPKQEVTGIPTFDDLMAQAGALDTKPEVKEEVKPEVKEEVKPEVKEEAKPEVKEEAKPKAKRTRAKTKTTTEPSEDLIDKDTVDEINTAIHGIVRNAVRKAFKDAMGELTKSFE